VHSAPATFADVPLP